MSFYVSTATFFLLHCDEWDRVVALPRHKFVTGATLLQLMSHHSDTLFWFRANQSLLFLLNAACLAEKQQIPILYYLVWPDRGLEPTIYRSRGEHANHYTADTVKLIYTDSISSNVVNKVNIRWRIHQEKIKMWTNPCNVGGKRPGDEKRTHGLRES